MSLVSLQSINTFNLAAKAHQVITVTTPAELASYWQAQQQVDLPVLILGEGSNVLFTTDFAGVVILNRIKGIEVSESDTHWYLHVGAGENWHDLVTYTIQHQMPGLENLALIPGCAGSAPIQNIGAYGVEFERFCHYVDVMDLNTGEIVRLTDLQFGYRDSIFKHTYRDGFAIVGVGLALTKNWQPVLSYGDLKECDFATMTPEKIYDAVCQIRRQKLPDPNSLGNAGSFFKNPVVTQQQADELLQHYPQVPHYPQSDGKVKLAAGWLIDQCGLKGYRIGGAAVHQKQALVLVNVDNATSADVVALAAYVNRCVDEKFGVSLEPEVRFIAQHGEVSAMSCLREV